METCAEGCAGLQRRCSETREGSVEERKEEESASKRKTGVVEGGREGEKNEGKSEGESGSLSSRRKEERKKGNEGGARHAGLVSNVATTT